MPEAAWTFDVRDEPAGQTWCGDAGNVVSADAERLVSHMRTVAAGSDRVRTRRVPWYGIGARMDSSRTYSSAAMRALGDNVRKGVVLADANRTGTSAALNGPRQSAHHAIISTSIGITFASGAPRVFTDPVPRPTVYAS